MTKGIMPSVFIGSSREGLNVAREVEIHLKEYAQCNIWTNGVFNLGEGTLDALLKISDEVNFAILILSSDDSLKYRSQNYCSPRDNVLFELGLFMGKLGPKRTFFVYENGVNLKLPTDLAGITATSYIHSKNLASSLSPACTPIIRVLQSFNESIECKEIKKEKESHQICDELLPSDSWYFRAVEIQMFEKCQNPSSFTGFIVGDNCLLTVLPECFHDLCTFRVRLYKSEFWLPAKITKIKSDLGVRLAILVVECTLNIFSGVGAFPKLGDKFDPLDQWHGLSYYRRSIESSEIHLLCLSGHIMTSCEDALITAALDVLLVDEVNNSVEVFRGSPFIVNDTLLGVVAGKNIFSNSIRVYPISNLFQDAGFMDSLGVDLKCEHTDHNIEKLANYSAMGC